MAAIRSTNTKKAERRVATRRQPAQGTVCNLTTLAGDDLCLGLVWNISTSGISMLMSKQLEAGTSITGELRAPKDLYVLPVTLRVAHVTRIRTGDFFIGAEFQNHLVATEIQPFLG
jgi:hypothetical protein